MNDRRPALFLDRDGVVNKNHGYVYEIEKFEFYSEIFQICLIAMSVEMPIVIVTNQSGIGRGFYSESDYNKLTGWMISQFSNHGIIIDDVIHAPENPEVVQDANSSRRKPSPAMFLEAAENLKLNMPESIMIGDNESDMISAHRAGIKHRILIGNPDGSTLASEWVESHESCIYLVRKIVARIRESESNVNKY